jgi:Tfp pilus assembly protein PilX
MVKAALQTRSLPHGSGRQTGAVLAVALILLTIMTLLALSANQATRAENRELLRLQAQQLTFQAAESALRAGETAADAHGNSSHVCDPHTCVNGTKLVDWRLVSRAPTQWWTEHAKRYGGPHGDCDCWFVVEVYAEPPGGGIIYRVTSRCDHKMSSAVVLQSSYAVPDGAARDQVCGSEHRPLNCPADFGRQSWRQLR